MAGSLEPQQLGKGDWYYEYPTHLLLVHEVRTREGVYIRTDQIKIPWRKIEKSLARIRRKPRKRRAA